MSASNSQRTPLHVEVNLQIGALQRDGLTGNALALLNRCYLIIKDFEERQSGPAGDGWNEAIEKAAALIEYRGQCAVQMINAEERIGEKKAYAWDALQHGIAIRDLKRQCATEGGSK